MTSTLHLHLLGDFLLLSDETPVLSINSPRLQSLLAYLVLHRSAPQDRSQVAFLLWPDSTEARAHSSLRKLLHQLRQAFPEIDNFLSIDHQCLHWRPEADACWTLDVQDLEQAFTQAEQAEQSQNGVEQRQALEQVLTLYRGELLPGCYDEWIVPERDRIRQVFFRAAERLLLLLEEERAYAEAIKVARRLLHYDPLHEATYRQLMRLYALRGERVAALRVYHSCVTVLERELMTEPEEATRQAYEALLHMDTRAAQSSSPLRDCKVAPLVGRKQEWRQMQAEWRKAVNGSAHLVVLSGEAGIGKTRLAEEMLAWADRQGIMTASTQCYASEGRLAYTPVATLFQAEEIRTHLSTLDNVWLSEIARLVPELFISRPDLPRPMPITESWQRQYFFEAMAHAILKIHKPILLLLDDLQWCDQETLQWLHYLLRFDSKARLLLIGTIRAEEMLPEHPLMAFLGSLQREGLLTEIALGPLSTTETTSLAEQVAQRRLEPALVHYLCSETEGNPLFIVEMVRAGTLEQSVMGQAEKQRTLFGNGASLLPPTVQSVLATRLAQLSPLAHGVAKVAAVIGHEFSFGVLAQACGESEENVVQALDELWLRRIIREQGRGNVYDFSHAKIREQVYTSLSPIYQRLLHRRVAEALSAIYKVNKDAVSGQIAAHYEHAGLPDQAIPYYQQSGKVAMHIYAHTEAHYAFSHARALLETQAAHQEEGDWETSVQVYEALGDVLAEMGRYQDARESFQQAASLVPQEIWLWQARLKRKTANTWNHTSTNPQDTVNEQARSAFLETEQILSQRADPGDPAWRDEWTELQFAQIWPLRGSGEDMATIIEKARPVIEAYGTEEQRERLTFAKAMYDLIHNRYVISEERLARARSILASTEQSRDKAKKVIGHLALGVSLLWAGYLDEAEKHLRITLEMGKYSGTAWLQIRSLTFLLFLFRRHGQVEQVRQLLVEAEEIGATRNNSVLAGQRAWLAWRDGNLAELESYAHNAAEEEQQMQSNPFQWVGRWPLFGIALAQEELATAMHQVRLLLDPSQQPPPDALEELLTSALSAWENNQPEQARVFLQEALPVAEKMGYL